MKHRQTVEEYWGVWIWCDATTPERWEPFDEGIRTRKAAERELASARKTYPDDMFALVHTRNERVVERTKSEHGGKK